MSINSTVGQVAASHVKGGPAIVMSQIRSALMAVSQGAGTASGSSPQGGSSQASQINQLLSQLEPNMGQSVNTLT